MNPDADYDLSMENARPFTGHFKQYAFMWRPAFSQRQTRLYIREDQKYDEGALDPNATTEEIVDNFVYNRCQDDVDRYMYRKDKVGNFLIEADIEALRADVVTESVTTPKVLMDDRNNDSVTRRLVNGNCRESHGPLNAHQFYRELLREVSVLNCLSFSFLCLMYK
jgi:hypothetical protein